MITDGTTLSISPERKSNHCLSKTTSHTCGGGGRVKINHNTVNTILQEHPDWPSLLCISDALKKWNILNAAGKIDTNQIEEIPTPFLAYTYDREFPLFVVIKVTDTDVEYLLGNYRKVNTRRKEDFLKEWSGVYLIAEPVAESGEEGFVQNRRKSFMQSMTPVSLFVVVFVLSLYSLYNAMNLYVGSSTGIYVQYAVYLAGIIVTTLLLWYEMDRNNPVLQKVCTGIAKGNCNAILTGDKSKVFSWLSWSEVGFFYFSGGLLVLLFSGDFSRSVLLLGILNLLALPYIFFSVYYQWRVARQWCVLCLAVQALLLLGGINVLVQGFLSSPPGVSPGFLISAFLLFLIPVLLWYAAKPNLLRLQAAKETRREYLRIKFNREIFDTLLKKQKAITAPVDGLGIDLGNPNAKNLLVKVCNPYCGPCSRAHPKIEMLLDKIPDLRVKIIFTADNKAEDPGLRPVSHLLAVNEKYHNEEKIKQALDDWYLANPKEYESFANKYPMNGELKFQGDKITSMRKWCDDTEIAFTPTFFVNGYQLPDVYSIEDLQYFLSE